jgi:hypothetical protein
MPFAGCKEIADHLPGLGSARFRSWPPFEPYVRFSRVRLTPDACSCTRHLADPGAPPDRGSPRSSGRVRPTGRSDKLIPLTPPIPEGGGVIIIQPPTLEIGVHGLDGHSAPAGRGGVPECGRESARALPPAPFCFPAGSCRLDYRGLPYPATSGGISTHWQHALPCAPREVAA